MDKEVALATARLIASLPRMFDALLIAKKEFESRDGAGTCPLEIEELLEDLSQYNTQEKPQRKAD